MLAEIDRTDVRASRAVACFAKMKKDPYGGDLLRRMKEVNNRTRDSRLKRISQALKIAVPQFGEIALADDSDGLPHLYASYVRWRPNAYKQMEKDSPTESERCGLLYGFLVSFSMLSIQQAD